jgi:hypothetical protein
MFARIVEFIPKVEKKEELIKVVRNEVLPILKEQPGFLEILPFLPESTTEKTFTVTLWAEKRRGALRAECLSQSGRDCEAVCRHSHHVQALHCGNLSVPELHGGPDGLM